MTAVLAALVCALTSLAPAPQDRRVPVEVRFVSGRSVYVSPGRDAGVRVGDRVVFEPAGTGQIEGRIESVSKSQARAVVAQARDRLVAGVRGYVLSSARAAKEPSEGGGEESGRWGREAQPEDPDAPLLRLGRVTRASERPTTWKGRVQARVDAFKSTSGARAQSSSARLGADALATNPFGYGGRLLADVEMRMRSSTRPFDVDDTSSRGRIDRLAYSWGHDRENPSGVTVGRFLLAEFSEFGVTDGVALEHDWGPSTSAAILAGFLPEPFGARASGDDASLAFGLRRAFGKGSGDGPSGELRVGVQKTWHRGAPDRDLVLASGLWRPSRDTTLSGSAWIDYYSGSERAHESGWDATDLRVHLAHRLAREHGVSVYANRLRWPDIRRSEFAELPADTIRNEERRTLGASSWHELSESIRLDLRGDWWEDRYDRGLSWDASVSLRDLVAERGELSLGVFRREGSFLQGPGVRVAYAQAFDGSWLRASYERSEFDFADGGRSLRQNALRADFDVELGPRSSLNLGVDHRFGGDADALNFGIFYQWRF